MRSLLFLILLLVPSLALAAPAARTEVPIREVDLSDGMRRYVVTLQIAGQPVEAGLDTGSTGLRVLARALPAAERDARGEKTHYAYSSGTRFDGTLITVPVALGSDEGSVRAMRIDTVGCRQDRPNCRASQLAEGQFGIEGNGLSGEGFAAILGIGLLPDRAGNPLAMLGARRWIVELPRPGRNEAGRLVINPDDAEIAAYRRIDLVADSNRFDGCIRGGGALGSICGPTLLDSGAPGLNLFTPSPVRPWPAGMSVTIELGKGAQMQAMTVTTGRRDEASGFFVDRVPDRAAARLSLGIAPYFHWSVLYDPGAWQIGLSERP